MSGDEFGGGGDFGFQFGVEVLWHNLGLFLLFVHPPCPSALGGAMKMRPGTIVFSWSGGGRDG